MDIDTISHYYGVRTTLEASALELACEHMSDEDIDAHEKARKAMIKHIRKSRDLARSVTLNQLQQAIKRHKSR